MGGVPVAPNASQIAWRSLRHLSIDVELLCEQMGGGAMAKRVDEDQWLRSAAVRGALRFWWRAVYAPTFDSVLAMRQAEGDLFGAPASGSEGAGRVAVGVSTLEMGDTEKLNVESYQPETVAYFPGVGMGQDGPAEVLREGKATITVSESPCRDHIGDEVWLQVQKGISLTWSIGGHILLRPSLERFIPQVPRVVTELRSGSSSAGYRGTSRAGATTSGHDGLPKTESGA